MKKQKRDILFFVEISIILVIAGCMVFLNRFMTNKIDELQQSAQDAIFVMEDLDYQAEHSLMEDIQDYIPSTYKMIEIYDEDFNQLIQLNFDNGSTTTPSIQDNQELMRTLSSSNEGQTSYTIDSVEQHVYFRWLTNSNGETRLMIIYSTIVDVEDLWVFSFVTYIVIILAFALLLVARCKMHSETIKNYNNVVKDRM